MERWVYFTGLNSSVCIVNGTHATCKYCYDDNAVISVSGLEKNKPGLVLAEQKVSIKSPRWLLFPLCHKFKHNNKSDQILTMTSSGIQKHDQHEAKQLLYIQTPTHTHVYPLLVFRLFYLLKQENKCTHTRLRWLG